MRSARQRPRSVAGAESAASAAGWRQVRFEAILAKADLLAACSQQNSVGVSECVRKSLRQKQRHREAISSRGCLESLASRASHLARRLRTPAVSRVFDTCSPMSRRKQSNPKPLKREYHQTFACHFPSPCANCFGNTRDFHAGPARQRAHLPLSLSQCCCHTRLHLPLKLQQPRRSFSTSQPSQNPKTNVTHWRLRLFRVTIGLCCSPVRLFVAD